MRVRALCEYDTVLRCFELWELWHGLRVVVSCARVGVCLRYCMMVRWCCGCVVVYHDVVSVGCCICGVRGSLRVAVSDL